MMIMANGKLVPGWRNFSAWSGIGAVFYLLVVWAITSLRHEDGLGAMVRSREVAATVGLVLIFTAALVGFTSWNRPINARTLGGFAIGNAVAIAACLLMMWSFGTGAFGETGASEAAALAVGAIFLIISAFIAAGLVNPSFGAPYLNVEDAGDLREQRPLLWRSELLLHDGGTGGFRSVLALEPAKALAAVALINSAVEPAATDLVLHILLGTPVAQTPPVPPAPPPPVKRTEISLPAAELERFVGRYGFEAGFVIAVTHEGGTLRVLREGVAGASALSIFPEAPLVFFWKAVDAQIRFTTDASGAVTGAELTQGGQSFTGKRAKS
jgi:hypothetical protein